MHRKRDYLFRRSGSQNWWIKLQTPGKRVEKSLGTSDRRQAEILALPMIAQHKSALLEARPRLEVSWQYAFEPNREHITEDGGRIVATDAELIYLDPNGRVTGRTPNGAPGVQLVNADRSLGLPPKMWVTGLIEPKAAPLVAVRTADDVILETYLKHAGLTGYFEREARAVWHLYKQLTGNKPLKDATRDDGRRVVAHFEARGIKSATIRKKVGWLTAAVNLAIKEGRLTFNPFASTVPKRNDKEIRLPLDDADMAFAKRSLDRLDKNNQLLFHLLASTGMRLSEAFEIDSEATERGCRYVIVGQKTEQSKRRVPLPATLLPYLPKTIKGALFKGTEASASKRLNRFLRAVGIGDKRKVVHSLRHRAQDRLRAVGCPEDIRWALLGHEKKTVAAGYGEGFPVPLLRKWIDRIGF